MKMPNVLLKFLIALSSEDAIEVNHYLERNKDCVTDMIDAVCEL